MFATSEKGFFCKHTASFRAKECTHQHCPHVPQMNPTDLTLAGMGGHPVEPHFLTLLSPISLCSCHPASRSTMKSQSIHLHQFKAYESGRTLKAGKVEGCLQARGPERAALR